MITSPPFLHISTRIYQRNLSTHPKYRLPQHVSIQLGLKHWQHFGALYSLSLSLSLSLHLSLHITGSWEELLGVILLTLQFRVWLPNLHYPHALDLLRNEVPTWTYLKRIFFFFQRSLVVLKQIKI
jgi:hypothetical protein